MPPATARPGLTLLEVVVATTLLGTGVLAALAVQATVVALGTRSAERRALAAHLDSTLDSLRASPCAALTAGHVTRRGGRIDWRLARGTATVTIDATVTPYPAAPAFHARSRVPCA